MSSPFQSAHKCTAVTPSDATNFDYPCEALWIGVGGTISFIPYDPAIAGHAGAAVATTVPAGLFPVRAMRVNATGTAATGIVAFN